MEINGNKAAAKEVIYMPGTATSRLPYTDYLSAISMAKYEVEQSARKLYNIKPCVEELESSHYNCRQYKVKLSRLCKVHSKLTRH